MINRHHLFVLISALLIGLLLTACASTKKAPLNITSEIQSIKIVSTLPDLPPKRDFRILDALVAGDTLKVKLSYMGGMEAHSFAINSTGKYMKTNPPQVNAYINHTKGQNDGEQSEIIQWYLFDVQNLRYSGSKSIRINLNDKAKTVEYTWKE